MARSLNKSFLHITHWFLLLATWTIFCVSKWNYGRIKLPQGPYEAQNLNFSQILWILSKSILNQDSWYHFAFESFEKRARIMHKSSSIRFPKEIKWMMACGFPLAYRLFNITLTSDRYLSSNLLNSSSVVRNKTCA